MNEAKRLHNVALHYNSIWNKIMDGKFLSDLTFAYPVLNTICFLSPLPYCIVSVHKCITCVTNKVLTSKHDCVLGKYTRDLDMPKRLANCKLYTKYSSVHP